MVLPSLTRKVCFTGCSQELCELGVVSGADLTVEAALTKLSYLLGQPDLDVEAVRKVKYIYRYAHRLPEVYGWSFMHVCNYFAEHGKRFKR